QAVEDAVLDRHASAARVFRAQSVAVRSVRESCHLRPAFNRGLSFCDQSLSSIGMTRVYDEDLGAGFGTRAVHAGQRPDPLAGAIMTPVYLTSTYVQEALGSNKGYEYARGKNPTREAFE